jgi:hypothetical protein
MNMFTGDAFLFRRIAEGRSLTLSQIVASNLVECPFWWIDRLHRLLWNNGPATGFEKTPAKARQRR